MERRESIMPGFQRYSHCLSSVVLIAILCEIQFLDISFDFVLNTERAFRAFSVALLFRNNFERSRLSYLSRAAKIFNAP